MFIRTKSKRWESNSHRSKSSALRRKRESKEVELNQPRKVYNTAILDNGVDVTEKFKSSGTDIEIY